MSRIWIRMIAWVGFLPVLAGGYLARAEGLGEKVLPASTKGFISVTNVEDLKAHWTDTQLGKLMADPVMEPFIEGFRQQTQEQLLQMQEKLGLTLEDLRDVPTGELTLAMVESPKDTRAVVVLMDVTGRLDEAQAMLNKAKSNLIANGARSSTTTDTDVIVLDLPDRAGQLPREAAYFLRDGWLGASDDQEVLKEVLARSAGRLQGSLATVEAFGATMARCQREAGDRTPQIRWFVEPIACLELMQKGVPVSQRPRGKTQLDIVKEQGFEAIRGIGGFVDLAVEEFDLLYHTYAHAPGPRKKSMKMMVFPNHAEFAPQAWVPREVATYATMYLDILNAFDNAGPLGDEVFGAGASGVWDDWLENLRDDPHGRQIDLREELIVHLASRISVVADYVMPITANSERTLVAIEIKDEEAVTKALEKTFGDDPEIVRHPPEAGHVIWEFVPLKAEELPTISIGAIPLFDEEEEDYEEEDQLIPDTAAVTVAHGHLLMASHFDFLKRILQTTNKRERLTRDVDFRVVTATLEKLGASEDSVRSFSRTDQEYRVTYELFKQGKLAEAQTIPARLINTILGMNEAGELRARRFDGSTLPDYDFVRRHLGPSGMFGKTEENGWIATGFLLSKQTQ